MATSSNPQSTGSAAPGGPSIPAPPDTTKGQNAAKPDAAAQADADSAAEQSAETSGPTHVAKFDSLGGVEERILTAKDFEGNAILDHGVEEDLVWKADNNFVVDVSHLTDEARDFLKKVPNIRITAKKDA